ncbi:DUF2269 family protein [Methylopila turkensis]|uniref:Membrane protein n=1 Tax=Methylopila turkensis TaxID=1437816 RepID=A0A9W6N739_9HYPH|nr:DUF2269 domain-containing protein [Methylopila turkensis]GLK80143.1 membrane protein [Methylopila turkensis]
MTLIDLLRWAHVVGAAVLLGTGSGIAFFMLMAHRTRAPALIAHVAGTVALADMIFTATAALLQPVTGAVLAHLVGWPLDTGWIVLSLILYVAIGLLWLPVVRMQIVMRDLARAAAAEGTPLPLRYHRLFRLWFWCGVPAFLMVLAIVWLMVARPAIPGLDT